MKLASTRENPSGLTCLSRRRFAARVRQELADILIYALLLCQEAGDPIDAIREKLGLNAEKYPVDLSRGNPAKYSELGE